MDALESVVVEEVKKGMVGAVAVARATTVVAVTVVILTRFLWPLTERMS